MHKTISVKPTHLPLEASQTHHGHGNPGIPEYLDKTYWWAYLHPRSVWLFERQWIVNLILWGNFARLRDSALAELGTPVTGRNLQVACVYGDFTQSLAARLAPEAHLDVVDVAPIQLENLRRKLGSQRQVSLECQNAARLHFEDASFDQVVVFFLLHEMPEAVRLKVIHEVLRVVKPGGKVVFVDYHRPFRWHPHRYLMVPILKGLEPYAMDLWRGEIADWIGPDQQPARLVKSTYFGGLYQKVVVTR